MRTDELVEEFVVELWFFDFSEDVALLFVDLFAGFLDE